MRKQLMNTFYCKPTKDNFTLCDKNFSLFNEAAARSILNLDTDPFNLYRTPMRFNNSLKPVICGYPVIIKIL
jgi:hypothetical protein